VAQLAGTELRAGDRPPRRIGRRQPGGSKQRLRAQSSGEQPARRRSRRGPEQLLGRRLDCERSGARSRPAASRLDHARSQVRLQRGSGGEASLQLSLPSARLSAALAELARLAPTRAQSQSLQDITDEYGAARTKLADAVAERRALLRALAKASTQGEIESLRARLSLAGGAVARARPPRPTHAKRAANADVEVTVLGDRQAGSERSALSNALHDAGDVLKLALGVLIVALAALVPLALLGVLCAIAWRASRRRLRERALS
jgi:hypothetical protein